MLSSQLSIPSQSPRASSVAAMESPNGQRSNTNARYTPSVPPMLPAGGDNDDEVRYHISDLPDDCLASIFQCLCSADLNRCSFVCRRWNRVEGKNRHCLSLNAEAELLLVIPSLFSRFDSVTKLALKCDPQSLSISDEALILISQLCPNLNSIKLCNCCGITKVGIEIFAKNCKGLKKFCSKSCTFGSNGMNALLDNCNTLEELSVKHVSDDDNTVRPVGIGVAASSLKSIYLKELNGQCFFNLILGAKKLKRLKVFRCKGDWDELFITLSREDTSMLEELHLDKHQMSDIGLEAISYCSNLEILILGETPNCTDEVLVAIAQRCKLLRELQMHDWNYSNIADKGLIAVAKCCPYLQKLLLFRVNPTEASLELLASYCQNLELESYVEKQSIKKLYHSRVLHFEGLSRTLFVC